MLSNEEKSIINNALNAFHFDNEGKTKFFEIWEKVTTVHQQAKYLINL